jgi:DNA repair photolyase
MQLVSIRGRGAAHNPPNRFETLHVEPDPEALSVTGEEEDAERRPPTRYLRDSSRSVIARNDSPDVPFSASLNPYRGCEHGCIYCYARPTHEYLGFSAGLDFETRILVKQDAPELLRAKLGSPKWVPETIAMAGVTDPYQPVERRLEVTRGCLEVLAEFRNPVAIVTKNHLVTRDADLLARLAAHGAALVNVSLTTLDERLQRVMEPRTSVPKRRLLAIEKLTSAGVPTRVLLSPIIPGLTDQEIPDLLRAAKNAGAVGASCAPVRLPMAVAPLFEDWLGRHFPDRREKVLNRIRSMRGGRLNDPRFGNRMRGEGIFADQMRSLFRAACRKLDFEDRTPPLRTDAFRRPASGGQLALFDG